MNTQIGVLDPQLRFPTKDALLVAAVQNAAVMSRFDGTPPAWRRSLETDQPTVVMQEAKAHGWELEEMVSKSAGAVKLFLKTVEWPPRHGPECAFCAELRDYADDPEL